MPLMSIPTKKQIQSFNKAALRSTGKIQKSFKHKTPLRSGYEMLPAQPVYRARASFSYAQPGTVLMSPDDTGIDQRQPFVDKAAEQPIEETAGEEMVRAMRGRTFETSQGLVVAEMPGEYEEEQGFGGLFNVGDIGEIGRWMEVNDRSSAATGFDFSNQAYTGRRKNMEPPGLVGLGSYDEYTKAAGGARVMVIARDLNNAFLRITASGSQLSRLNRTALINEMKKVGYPAAEVMGLVDLAANFLPAKYRNQLYASARQAAPPPPSQPQMQSAGGLNSILPLAAAAAIAAVLIMKKGV